jgi:diguanylate cyclase (GGDEF)-like protein
MGNSGAQVCPHLTQDIRQSLLNLQERISDPTPALVRETQQQLEKELREWAEGASEYFKSKACEVRDLMMVLARTAESVGERDQKYNRQIGDFQARLEAIADLEDLTKIRKSLLQSALELKGCVDRMAEDSQTSALQMQHELAKYQTRLKESERLASIDALTGLNNRRKLELELETRLSGGRTVSIMMFDIDGFKQINDQMGHLAGDRILKQFATELRAAIRSTDIVGRWAGDEFLAILNCNLEQAQSQTRRIRDWVFGNYSIPTPGGPSKVKVTAAIGLAQSEAGDTLIELLERADAAMYREKLRHRTAIPISSAGRPVRV